MHILETLENIEINKVKLKKNPYNSTNKICVCVCVFIPYVLPTVYFSNVFPSSLFSIPLH